MTARRARSADAADRPAQDSTDAPEARGAGPSGGGWASRSLASPLAWAVRGLAAALYAVPLLLALALALRAGSSPAGWQALWADSQWPRALAASLATALASTAIALVLTLLLVTALHGSRAWRALAALLAPMLAVPHAAFAIGLALLVMPSGPIARALAPGQGWIDPPDWATVQDPLGLGLVAVLVAKELPFLLWHVFALLQRPEVALALQRQIAVVRTLGYGRSAAWWRVLWPQWLPRLAWPLLAVLGYGLTVVDMALVIGPAAPPTLAVLAWQWLQDADPARHAQGAAASVLLAGLLVLLALAGWGGGLLLRVIGAAWVRRGQRALAASAGAFARTRERIAGGVATGAASAVGLGLVALYLAVLAMLGLASVAGLWPFPDPLPSAWQAEAWRAVARSAPTLAFSAGLALAAGATAVALVVAWLEATPARWDARIAPLLMLPVVVPGLLLVVGLYQGALWLRLDGTRLGLWWVHTLMALPYVAIALAPSWRSFDRRYEWTGLALGRSRAAVWWRVKRPMLAAPLAAAGGVGFAVSVAQYLPTLYIGAGRHATVTTEAVTLAAGGQRATAAAFALLQALLPLAGFALAHRVAARATRALR